MVCDVKQELGPKAISIVGEVFSKVFIDVVEPLTSNQYILTAMWLTMRFSDAVPL